MALPAQRLDTTAQALPSSEEALHRRYESAFESIEAPFAFVDLDAMWWNADDMLRRAGTKPIRVASKSLRSRGILDRILARDPGFQGLLTFTLPETLFLAKHGFTDMVVAYPTADLHALAELAELTNTGAEPAPAVMVDSPAHLDSIEAVATTGNEPARVCMELDVSFWIAGGRVKIGTKRSPIRTAEAAVALAREIERRPALRLVGLMAYEGHIAGLGDRIPGRPLRSALVRRIQQASAREIRERRAAVVEALSGMAELEFVNGGGTGSIELTASEPSVTEIAAGSGFYAPTLFDYYSAFTLRPAAMFVLPVVRKPAGSIATALGGGYVASGTAEKNRLPKPFLPPGLRLDSNEGAGEVQTPLLGPAARRLEVGDRVYLRHAKAGELCERFNSLYLVEAGEIVDQVPTYRGDGHSFL